MRTGKFESGSHKPIGTGSAKEVFVNPRDSEKVVSVVKEGSEHDKLTPRALKATFYLTKIAHILFPDQTPDIHQVAKTTEGQITLDRERIEHTPGHAAFQTARQSGQDIGDAEAEMRAEFRSGSLNALDLKLERAGFGSLIDATIPNYIKGERGKISYLESFTPWVRIPTTPPTFELLFDQKALTRAIKRLKDPHMRADCEKHLARVLALFQEERAEAVDLFEKTRLEAGPLVIQFEEALATAEATHNLELLFAIETEEEAMKSQERKAARITHAELFKFLRDILTMTNISEAKYLELDAALARLGRAIGSLNRGKVDHTR